MFQEDTIAAIATGLMDSGIGIVRISGSDAVAVGNCIFRSPSGKASLCCAESHVLSYGFAVDVSGSVMDEVMAVVMKAPRSFTGEDTVEIQCHGGVLVMKKILDAALQSGARLAEPGEFTKRAFLNGRIDLSRAEAVMDLIHSKNEYALSSSVGQLRGSLYREIRQLREEILYEMAYLESALDDPEHISLDGYEEGFSRKLSRLTGRIEKLLSTSQNGKWVQDGIHTVILGKPNVGKSSILNLLLGEDRAIVTEIAGTTRDVLQERLILGGMELVITDTAGIRDTEDKIEKIGVEKSRKYAQDADLILYVIDSSAALDESDREIFSLLVGKKVIVLLNKSDLPGLVSEQEVSSLFEEVFSEGERPRILRTSAAEGVGLEELEQALKEIFFQGLFQSKEELVITNLRHSEALKEALSSLQLVKKTMEDGMPADFYSIDLMDAYTSLGRIIGEEVDDDLIEEIFSRFCMGK